MSLSDWVNTNKRPLARLGDSETPGTIFFAQKKFLESLRQGSSSTKACEDAGIGKPTAYRWRRDDSEFEAAWDDARESGTDRLEDEAYRRAHDGIEKPIVYQGQLGREDDWSYRERILSQNDDPNDTELIEKLLSISDHALDMFGYRVGVRREILSIREHSDTMMITMLKARRPNVYRERTTTIVTGPNGGPIQSFHVVVDPIEAARTYQSIMDGK